MADLRLQSNSQLDWKLAGEKGWDQGHQGTQSQQLAVQQGAATLTQL